MDVILATTTLKWKKKRKMGNVLCVQNNKKKKIIFNNVVGGLLRDMEGSGTISWPPTSVGKGWTCTTMTIQVPACCCNCPSSAVVVPDRPLQRPAEAVAIGPPPRNY